MDVSTLPMILAWGVFVGIVFSAIGAAGGILTSFGMITLFGVMDPNSVKPMTQIVVLSTALIFVPGYLRRASAVVPLGLLLGGGGLVGAYVGSTISSLYLSDMASFRPMFGLLTLAIAGQIFWKLIGPSPPQRPTRDLSGVRLLCTDFSAVSFRHGGRLYSVPTWSPVVAGFIIAMTAAIFGVGGGFLLVPYMASLLGMPMHIIPATAAIAIIMSLLVSISNFVAMGAPLQWPLLIPLAIGAVAGAILGPVINKRMKNSWLQAVMGVIVLGIGIKYVAF
ncbi:sulfite exporter TauE/SafE family protein [Alisedimentitalea sp. MJ-SS2]|uniref:sulfite exporter TauE/SafE family protein n=1 Tax=Aliisedimentitalea sp. MJ-SS2 TaxID=3049795 RepID=UPI00290F7836|nr:sulfite exporter TauE/SafE family protein [Alisedimentitalea sp. MJ-SS2]MDU8926056.1 sulfite exporter TauE/SafE family protein [Alisedimentitalea sp. MJ-SS2]